MNKLALGAGLLTAGAFAAVSFPDAKEQGREDVAGKPPLKAVNALVGTSIRESLCAIEVGAAGAGAALLANHSHCFGGTASRIVQMRGVQFGLKALGVTMIGTGIGMLAGNVIGGVQGAVSGPGPAHADDGDAGHGH